LPAAKKSATAKAPAATKAAKPTKRAAAPAPAEPVARPVPADKWLAKQQAALLAARAERLADVEELRAEADQLARDAEPGDTQFDDESGEGSTTAVDRERDLALAAQALAEVQEIDLALDKLDAGAYGTCERCGKPIPKARLEAIPWASQDVSCKSGGLSARR
jgi:DnaK suppressor protein